jgi:sugar lactone lactonase YvrE
MENKNIEVHALCKALNLRADRFIEIAEACNACRDNKGNLWLIGEEMIQKFTKEAKLPSELPDPRSRWARREC